MVAARFHIHLIGFPVQLILIHVFLQQYPINTLSQVIWGKTAGSGCEGMEKVASTASFEVVVISERILLTYIFCLKNR
jgi:hypothetical protein